MSDKAFVDTNVFVYAVSGAEDVRSQAAAKLLRTLLTRQHAVVSYQVVQEFLNVVLTKFKQPMPVDKARRYVAMAFTRARVVPSSYGLFSEAIDIRTRYKLSWYDSLIVAAAREAKCSVLYTEDLHHGMNFDGLRVENPFLQ